MDATLTRTMRELVLGRSVAALGTLHAGEPFVSMVPYALAHPRVSLLITAAEGGDTAPQALPRLSVQGDALPLARDGGEYAAGKTAYLARFAEAAQMFELTDFSLFLIQPVALRFVAGFGKAFSPVPEVLARALDGG
ncbi:MAG: hypothetical protein NT115_16710 [Proteobacteria bacterium]|nr:hypothetical protein [Pseudomonadota bacterium]